MGPLTAEPIAFSDFEPGLSLSPIPVWVIDVTTIRALWANDAALHLWQAPDRSELFNRDIAGGAPPKVLARFHNIVAQVRRGEILQEEWAFYPRGKHIMVLLHLRAVIMPDGRLAMLNQAVKMSKEAPASLRRAITALRHISALVAFVDAQGTILMQNPAAMAEFGDTPSWTSWLVDAEEANAILRDALAGETVRLETRVRTRNGERWHAVDACALRDPVTGAQGILLQHKDETARVEAERTAAARLALLERQREEILALSAPLLDVGHGTLALPLIGRLDDARCAEITNRLLAAVVARGIRRAILDLTGLSAIDGSSIGRIRGMVEGIRLLGATPVLTGIRPDVARIMTESAFDLQGVAVMRSLSDGLK